MDAPIAVGAEAVVTASEFLGRKAVVKTRVPKGYRHADLDLRIRSSRTRNEVRVMRSARSENVRTPVIYDVDMSECSITMEFIEGVRVKELLDGAPSSSEGVCRMIGEVLAEMHNQGIAHGDFTTSNMILMQNGKLCIIDFSLGGINVGIEEMGVDIRLLQRAFSSAHSAVEGGFDAVMDAYVNKKTDAGAVVRKLEEIRNRARYT
ncbi:MAG: regulating kinase and related kinase [Candidatus Methanomethylophilaceae archaeon]|nr:regulating kinase and related kinase [Candidatus Methanomethylophilaceae archaeon]